MNLLASLIALMIFILIVSYVMGDKVAIVPVGYLKSIVLALLASTILYGITGLQPAVLEMEISITDIILFVWGFIAIMCLIDCFSNLSNMKSGNPDNNSNHEQ